MNHPDTRAAVPDADASRPTGFGPLPCPRCGEEGTVSLDLDDLDHFRCVGCDGEFPRGEVEAIITAYRPVLAWIAMAPTRDG